MVSAEIARISLLRDCDVKRRYMQRDKLSNITVNRNFADPFLKSRLTE